LLCAPLGVVGKVGTVETVGAAIVGGRGVVGAGEAVGTAGAAASFKVAQSLHCDQWWVLLLLWTPLVAGKVGTVATIGCLCLTVCHTYCLFLSVTFFLCVRD
jgi:hypothetical protein